MYRRYKEKKEPEDNVKKETKEEPKEETFAERRRRRLAERAEREKQREKEKEKEKQEIKEEEIQPPKEEKKPEDKPEPKRYTRRFKKDIQQKQTNEEKEIKQEEKEKQKEIKLEEENINTNNDNNDNINKEKEYIKDNNINNDNNIEKNINIENEKKISSMKKEYDKLKITPESISDEKPEDKPDDKQEEDTNQVIDLSGEAFNNKLEELSKLAKTTQLDYFFEGTYCDIKDPNTSQWKTGLVLERTDTEAKIKYYYSNINKTIFTFNVSDAIDKDIAMFRKYTQEENYYFNNAYQKMKSEAVTNPRLFEAKAALKVLCNMKNFSNKEFDEAFESPLEIIQELRGKLYYIFLNIINDNFQFEYVEEQKAINRRKNPTRAKKEEEEENEKFDIENIQNL